MRIQLFHSIQQGRRVSPLSGLIELGYVTRATDPEDARRKRVEVTALGHEVMRVGEATFDDVRRRLQEQIGIDGIASLEAHLIAIVGDSPVRAKAPGWVGTSV